MSLLDRLAENHILAALQKGELDNLAGEGKPLQLDDDSHIPSELRAGYRLLKNSGFLPPEMQLRREAVELVDLLRGIEPYTEGYEGYVSRLNILEMRMAQAGMSTEFLHGGYGALISHHFAKEK